MVEPFLRRRAAWAFALTVVAMWFACLVARAQTVAADGPDPQEILVPPIATTLGTLPGVNELPVRRELPDPLVMRDGSRMTTTEQWSKRRAEIKRVLEYYAIGSMPPPPGNVTGHEIKSQTVRDGTVKYRLVQLTFGPDEKLELSIGIFTPEGGVGPFPAVIMPGGTPPGATPLPMLPHPPGQGYGVDALLPIVVSASAASDSLPAGSPTGGRAATAPDAETIAARNRELFRRGYAFVTFNNNDCAEDTTLRNADGSWAFRTTRFFPAYPGYDWGVLAGWAWGVLRIVDYLETYPAIDRTMLIVSGVSRTGKSAMIAAAFDERIAMAASCVTGGGGIGAYRFCGEGRGGKEGLDVMMKKYPNWFSPYLHEFWGNVGRLPFDEHWFLALMAPRPFIALEGMTDQVSLANAVKQSYLGAQPVYALFDATNRLGVNYGNHGHAYTAEDATALMDFADRNLRGMQVDRHFDEFPEELVNAPEPQATQK
jgi:hypothetical protein